MRRHCLPSTLILLLSIALPTGELAAGKLYKWVDDKGTVHYGDRIPPEYSRQGHTELNKQGITVNTTAGSKTGEQLTEEQRKQQALADEKRRAADQAVRDKALLGSYTSERDIIQVRDRKLATLEGEISMNAGYSEKLGQRLATQRQEADQLAQQGTPVPEKLQKDMRDTEMQIEKYTRFIKSRQGEQTAIRQQAENDIKRFRELRGDTPNP
jgi:hypothetical protein